MTIEHAKSQKESNYPAGVWVIFSIQLLSMIGFSMILGLLVLYLTQIFDLSDDKAYTLFAAYSALVYGASVLGGYIGELIGYRLAVSLSLILGTIGLALLALPGMFVLVLGLSLFILATALNVPASFVLLGRLYKAGDKRRDSGFLMSYIGMNIGAFLAFISAGFFKETFGFHSAFIIGAIFSAIALVIFLKYKHLFVVSYHTQQEDKINIPVVRTARGRLKGIIFAICAVPALVLLLEDAYISNWLLIILGIFCAFLILYLASQEKPKDGLKLIAFLILTIVAVSFWTLYLLSPSALTIFVERNVDRHLFGILIPTPSVMALNPFFIIVLGPLLSWMWLRFAKMGWEISTASKFAIGILSMGIGYIVLDFGIASADAAGMAAFSWIVLSYFFQTLGELFVGPVGFAMVGNLVPSRFEGVMMGIWQLSTGVAGALSSFLARQTSIASGSTQALSTDPVFARAFTEFGLMAILIAILTFLLVPLLGRIGGDRKRE